MNFDKTKAMRNAEKHVANGKIRAAIAEYRMVVENDPRDIGTLNMLGDLYAKNSEKHEAVECYMQVAEHYSKQGFSQKAIAIYNKVSRLQPDSIEVSTKLAELYKVKGSLGEARAHYTTLAEHYQKNGRRLEALAMWKQIALLDPNNTEVCMNLGESYIREGHRDDAAEAYAEAGTRFSRLGRNEEAINALMKGHEIRRTDLRILDGLVKTYSALGRVSRAVNILEDILDDEPYNRDVLYLLIDCHIDSQNAAGAERAVTKLVEMEPANYPKLLDLIRIYLNAEDLDSATRILSMSSEYLLAAGQGDECKRWIVEILERDHSHMGALRLLAHHATWAQDEAAYAVALARLAEAARNADDLAEERYALSQLVVVRPFESDFADRLRAINNVDGFEEEAVDPELIRAQFQRQSTPVMGDEVPAVSVIEQNNGFQTAFDLAELTRHTDEGQFEPPLKVDIVEETLEADVIEDEFDQHVIGHSTEQKLQKEIESVKFYIESGYSELAERAIGELEEEFGDSPAIAELRGMLSGAAEESVRAASLGIDEIRSEFGLDENDPPSVDDDYETHYHLAVAYQEMGLMEEAIKEFQDAINFTQPEDGSRRFFRCSNLLGHCFFQNGMANLAVKWFLRALETPDLTDEESHGIFYELGLAYEAEGSVEESARYFEQIYAENVDFRDVAERVKNSLVSR